MYLAVESLTLRTKFIFHDESHSHIFLYSSLFTPTHRFHSHLLPLSNRFYDESRLYPLKCHLLPATDCHSRNVEQAQKTVDYRMVL